LRLATLIKANDDYDNTYLLICLFFSPSASAAPRFRLLRRFCARLKTPRLQIDWKYTTNSLNGCEIAQHYTVRSQCGVYMIRGAAVVSLAERAAKRYKTSLCCCDQPIVVTSLPATSSDIVYAACDPSATYDCLTDSLLQVRPSHVTPLKQRRSDCHLPARRLSSIIYLFIYLLLLLSVMWFAKAAGRY